MGESVHKTRENRTNDGCVTTNIGRSRIPSREWGTQECVGGNSKGRNKARSCGGPFS